MDADRVLAILQALQRERVHYKVVGGVALNLLGLARTTEDLDIFVKPDPENVRSLKAALRAVYDDPEIEEISADDLGGPYPAIQYIPPDGDFSIDILARLGDAFGYEDIDTETCVIEGIEVPVATPRALYDMKKGTVRPQDRADASRLAARFDLEED